MNRKQCENKNPVRLKVVKTDCGYNCYDEDSPEKCTSDSIPAVAVCDWVEEYGEFEIEWGDI